MAQPVHATGLDAERIARALNLSTTIAEWLLGQGHLDTTALARFLDPRLAHLTPPDQMADRTRAAERLATAIRERERISVFGDYDCDGITSAAIMTEVIRTLGGKVLPLLASRFDGGYGVSPAAVERILAAGTELLVTCDCGSSDHETLATLGREGVEVIVIDHHLVPAAPLPALAFLNPHRPECGFQYKGLASCGLALSVAAALRRKLGATLDLKAWLDLVAIGTIADVAPLDGDNRSLVRAGLRQIALRQRPGLRALLERANIDLAVPLTGRDVAFKLAPRINAPGRMGPPDVALQLLIATDLGEAGDLAGQLEDLSEARRASQARILEEAVAEIESCGYAHEAAIVVGRDGWNHGIVGIVAGKLSDRYQRPSIVIGFEGTRGRGSVRGPAGSRLHDALSSVSDVLERYGGHQAAAGLEVSRSKLPLLRERFAQAITALPALEVSNEPASVRLAAEDEPLKVVQDLERIEPCGAGNPRPRFALEGRIVAGREVTGGHLKFELELPGGRRLNGFGARLAEQLSGLTESRKTVLVLGDLRRDGWRGGDAVEVWAEEIRC